MLPCNVLAQTCLACGHTHRQCFWYSYIFCSPLQDPFYLPTCPLAQPDDLPTTETGRFCWLHSYPRCSSRMFWGSFLQDASFVYNFTALGIECDLLETISHLGLFVSWKSGISSLAWCTGIDWENFSECQVSWTDSKLSTAFWPS
jgi:hypothetical protein